MRLINVDALKESFGDERLDGDWCICGDETTARDLVDEAPIIDAEPVRHGKWIDVSGGYLYECSKCKAQANSNQFKSNLKYCPNCGAKMDLGD